MRAWDAHPPIHPHAHIRTYTCARTCNREHTAMQRSQENVGVGARAASDSTHTRVWDCIDTSQCNPWKHTATHGNTRQHMATHGNALIYRIKVSERVNDCAVLLFKKKRILQNKNNTKSSIACWSIVSWSRLYPRYASKNQSWRTLGVGWTHHGSVRVVLSQDLKSHKSHMCFEKSPHVPAKEPCIPSRNSPLLPINTKPYGHVWFLYLHMYLSYASVHVCIYVSMRICVYLCICVCMHLCAYLCIFLFMYQCIYTYKCISISVTH